MNLSEKKQKPWPNQSSTFLPQEIVIEILLRLPVQPLFRTKCVSQQWNSIISDPQFGRSYMQRTKSPSLWGILPRHITASKSSSDDDVNDPPSLYLPDLGDIRASSNGLVLCSGWTATTPSLFKLCVCNPLTKQSFELPSSSKYQDGWNFYLAARVDSNTAKVSYRVVLIRNRAITVFCSDTGRWSHKKEVKGCPPNVSDSTPLTCKGILHWFDLPARILLTYDPYDGPDRFGRVRLPRIGPEYRMVMGVSVIQAGQEDVVKFGVIEDRGGLDRRLIVWRLLGYYEKREWCWCAEQTCLISPLWEMPPRLQYEEQFCCLGAQEEECVERCDVIEDVWPRAWTSNVALALCPWASPSPSPCYGKDTASSEVGFRQVFPLWVSCLNKYRGLFDCS